MDVYERIARDLEKRQQKRYRKCQKKIDFWIDRECEIYEAIKIYRQLSKTYHPSEP